MTVPRATDRAGTLTVRAVANAADVNDWVNVPFRLHGHDPAWVPPLRSDARKEMSWKTNPFHRHAHVEHFLLRESGVVVGRVAATVHPAYNERHDRKDVFFGFLDAPADPDRLAPLLRACEEFGRHHGAQVLAGPYSYWSGAELGMLTNEFDRPTAVFQPWNPTGMSDAMEELGFTTRTSFDAFEIDVADLAGGRDHLYATADRISASTGITTRPFRMRAYREDGEVVRRLNNGSFAASSEVLPYPPDVFDHMLGQLRPLMDPNLVRIAVRDGEPIGFGLTLPDVNQLLSKWRGRLTPWDMLRLPRDRRRVDEAVVLLLGVLPRTPMGVAHLLFADTLRALEAGGYKRIHTTWVHEENDVMRTLLGSALSIPTTRRWVVLSRELP